MEPKLTRARLEASATSEEDLRCFLLDVWETLREGDEWIIEDEHYLPTNDGFWGRLTMRRKEPNVQ